MKLYKAEQYKDERGIIFNATPQNPYIRNVMYITGKQWSIRGSHVHKKDSHYCLVVLGILQYEWQKGDGEKMVEVLYPGDVVLSEPGEKHKFIFLEDGAFVAMATEPRDHDTYEDDLTRVDF